MSEHSGRPGHLQGTDDPGADARHRMRLADERTDYLAGSLTDELLTEPNADPFALFGQWMEEAFARREEVGDLPEPTAVVLSTVDLGAGGPRPRSRTVLLKGFDEDGFVLYTHRESAKGRQLAATPWAALLFPWLPLQRQVRIDGRIEDVPDADADAYWASRPRGSQLGSAASAQSQPIGSRAALDARYAELEARYEGADVPRPEDWGGYRVVPDRIEFWQGRTGRLHDRIVFTRLEDAPEWEVARLQP